MVRRQRTRKGRANQEQRRALRTLAESRRCVRITADTPHTQCSERLTAFGGLLALVKFLALIDLVAERKRRHARTTSRESTSQ